MSFSVPAWLEMNGFGRYADMFSSHEIDAEALKALTDEHLKEMGVSVGPRIKLLKAIKGIGLEASTAAPDVSDAPVSDAERRHLTVMFVDLVGSTALSVQLDPEDLRDIIRSYQGVIAHSVAQYGGHVAQYLGDGALVFFGYPVAHEDAAEQAVRAALELLNAIHNLRNLNDVKLEARVGIATGLVVVGDLIGEGAAKENAVVGETPNLAARLQSVADTGQIIVAERTRELTGHLFELSPLRPLTLKGISGEVTAYVVVGERTSESRFEARQPGQLSPMVGRANELELLLTHWQKTKAGNGQITVITGDPGIGKSRIVRALRDTIDSDSYIRTSYQCSPHHIGSALYPVIQQVLRVAGIRATDTDAVKLDKLEALLVDTPNTVQERTLIASLIGVDTSVRYPPLDMEPEQRRLRTFDALINQIMTLADAQPLLLVVEDAHWIDPTTLELIEMFAARLSTRRIMILVTTRPVEQSVIIESGASHITLNRLGLAQVAALIQSVARGKTLPDKLMQEIVSKTDGVPLFAEELTKVLLESGELEETREAFVAGESLNDLALPASLQDSLMARLDRLQPVKEVAQTAACIGREFDLGTLGEILPLPAESLTSALQLLGNADMIVRRGGAGPEVIYSFRHALVRDAAYNSLLRSRRYQIHGLIRAVLESRDDAAPEVIAYHATQAGQIEIAIGWWQKAAASALARPAFAETIGHLNQAIRLTERMGEAPPWPDAHLGLLMALGQSSMAAKGYGHADTIDAFTRARELSNSMRRKPYRFTITYGLWVATYLRGEQDKALGIARDMVDWAEADQNEGHMISALRSRAISEMISGAPIEAKASFEEAGRVAASAPELPPEQRAAVAQRFAADPNIGTSFHHALTLWSLGYITEARERTANALAEARAMNHVHTLAHALTHAAIFSVIAREADDALAIATETLAYADEYDLQMWKGYGSILKACALAMIGNDVDSASLMEQGFRQTTRSQTGSMVPLHHAVQARTLARLERFEEAGIHADLARQELRSGSERYLWSELNRLLGDYQSFCPGADRDAIEATYTTALDIARAQRAPAWTLTTAISLAGFWAVNGNAGEARALLQSEMAAFPDEVVMPAYEEAKSLLGTI